MLKIKKNYRNIKILNKNTYSTIDLSARRNAQIGIEMEDNRKVFIISISIILFVILAIIGSLAFFKIQTGKITKVLDYEEREAYEKYYVMIVNDRTSEFWKTVYDGAKEDGQETNVYVEMLGNNLSEEYSREELMKVAINSQVDGIIVEADESAKITELINEAVNQQIPVVTVLGDNTSGERQSFVGVGSYNLGREYGRQVIELCGQNEKNVLILMSGSSDGTSQNVLFSGIQETAMNEMPKGGGAHLEMKMVDNENTFSAEESIRDIFMSSEVLPDIIICLDELSTACVYQAVVDYNKVGSIDIIGYYDAPSILQAIERNVIYSTISIDTSQMGRLCVEALNEFYELGNVSEYFSVDVTVINSDNVVSYIGDGKNDE